jgi:hypothetical protein
MLPSSWRKVDEDFDEAVEEESANMLDGSEVLVMEYLLVSW